jgi:hypothetical protein
MCSFFVFKSLVRLIQTGTSSKLRRILAIRIITQWLIYISVLIDSEIAQYTGHFLLIFCLISLLALIVRLSEPLVWKNLTQKLCCRKKKRVSFSSSSLNSFVNSAMNIEFVCLILSGVTECMAHSLENEENTLRAYTIQDVNLNTENRWSVRSGYSQISAV